MAGENFTLTRSNLVTVCSDDTNILYPLTITDQVVLTSELSAEEITLTQWIKNLVIPSPTGIDIDPEYDTGLLLATINDVLIKVPTAGYANYGLIKINSDYFAFDGDSDSLVTNFQWVPNSSYGDSTIGIGSIRGDNNKLISNVTMPTPSLDYSIGTDNAYLQLDLDLGNTNLQQLQISKEDIQAIALDGFTGIGSYTLSVDSTGTELTLSDGTDPHTTTATIASYTAGTGINITGTGIQKTVSLQYGAGDGIIFDTENNQIKLAQAAYDNSSTPTVDTFGGIRLGYDNTSSPNNKPLKVDTNGRAYIENTEGAGTLTIKLGDNTTLGTFAANQTVDTTVNIPLNLTYEVVTTLPTTNISTNCIYLILDTVGHQASDNIYNEYMYINNDWELLGTTEVTFTQQQADWTEDNTSAASFINNKPTLASVATSGSYNDLINKPNFATVATSGSYTDLSNKPVINNSLIGLWGGTDDEDSGRLSIGTFNLNQSSGENIYIPRVGGADGTNAGHMGLVPAPSATDNTKFLCGNGKWATPTAPVQSDWNQSDDTALDYIKNKPTIPAAQVQSDWNANSGMGEILNKPSLATVATSGNYSDLNGKPTIPAAANNATITIATNNNESSSDSFGDFTVDASTATTINIPKMKGATTSANGLAGLVPAPTSSDRDSVLRGNGSWGSINPTVGNFISNGISAHYFNTYGFYLGCWVPIMKIISTNLGKASILFDVFAREDSGTSFAKFYFTNFQNSGKLVCYDSYLDGTKDSQYQICFQLSDFKWTSVEYGSQRHIIIYKRCPSAAHNMYTVIANAQDTTTYAEFHYYYTGNNSSIAEVGYSLTRDSSAIISSSPGLTNPQSIINISQMPNTGSSSPTTSSIVPDFIGQQYIDTSSNKKVYVAVGTSSSSDWVALN